VKVQSHDRRANAPETKHRPSGSDSGGKVTGAPGTVTKKVLSSPQLIAIETLLLTGSVSRAAKAAGVTPKTIYAWLKSDRFQEGIREVQRETLLAIALRLSVMADRAADTLEAGMDPKHDMRVRLRACEIYFTKAIGWLQFMETEERLEALERALDRGRRGHAATD